MRLYVTIFIKRFAVILEFFITIMLGIGILLLCLRMGLSLTNIPNLDVWPNYNDLLDTCFNLIIGVELIRMMYQHTPDTVFEVLLFAIARHIIIDNSSILEIFPSCIFATRRPTSPIYTQAPTPVSVSNSSNFAVIRSSSVSPGSWGRLTWMILLTALTFVVARKTNSSVMSNSQNKYFLVAKSTAIAHTPTRLLQIEELSIMKMMNWLLKM